MLRILLLDCSESLEQRLKSQGFDVESGTVGFCTGTRELPSQVYEKEIFVYDPKKLTTRTSGNNSVYVDESEVKDATPHYSLQPLQTRIESGATVLVFLNKLTRVPKAQAMAFKWIPFMPPIDSTRDKVVQENAFSVSPDSAWKILSPIVTTHGLSLPVLQKLRPAGSTAHPPDTFYLFWNGNGDALGILILRGRGRLIVLPTFQSNDSVIETFLHRVVPKIYETTAKAGLVEMFTSPSELTIRDELETLRVSAEDISTREEVARVRLATATREKSTLIHADATATQILTYYGEARKQPDIALFFLYKVIESIENKFGGEASGIAAVGAGAEWKAVKKLANESYRDARHAPKPTDVIKQWSEPEIKQCFANTEKVVLAYFATIFAPDKHK